MVGLDFWVMVRRESGIGDCSKEEEMTVSGELGRSTGDGAAADLVIVGEIAVSRKW